MNQEMFVFIDLWPLNEVKNPNNTQFLLLPGFLASRYLNFDLNLRSYLSMKENSNIDILIYGNKLNKNNYDYQNY